MSYTLPAHLVVPTDGTPVASVVSYVDDRISAWANSRPNIKDLDLSEMADTYSADFGINSMAYATLQIQSSVLVRELLATFRGCNMWARTSRVLPIPETQISKEYLELAPQVYEESVAAVQVAAADLESGVPQDIARLGLPLSASTCYYLATDLRTWVVICKVLANHAGEVGKFYSKLIWDQLSEHTAELKSLDDYKYDTKGIAIKSLEIDVEADFTPVSMATAGNVVTSFRAKIGLAAQFARHKFNQYRSSIWSIARDDFQHHTRDMNTEILVTTTMPEASYKTMLSHRAEWLADWGLWSSFVQAGTKHMTTEQFWNLLDDPNNYLGDNMERIRRTDPNLPDPRIIESPTIVLERVRREGNTYIGKRWLELVDQNYITTNPENELRKMYRGETNASIDAPAV